MAKDPTPRGTPLGALELPMKNRHAERLANTHCSGENRYRWCALIAGEIRADDWITLGTLAARVISVTRQDDGRLAILVHSNAGTCQKIANGDDLYQALRWTQTERPTPPPWRTQPAGSWGLRRAESVAAGTWARLEGTPAYLTAVTPDDDGTTMTLQGRHAGTGQPVQGVVWRDEHVNVLTPAPARPATVANPDDPDAGTVLATAPLGCTPLTTEQQDRLLDRYTTYRRIAHGQARVDGKPYAKVAREASEQQARGMAEAVGLLGWGFYPISTATRGDLAYRLAPLAD